MKVRAAPARTRCAVLGCALALAACGDAVVGVRGGLDTTPPRVSLEAPATALAGMSVRLTAIAEDDRAIERVAFYAVDGRNEVRVGIAERRPYEIEARLPLAAPARLRYIARAIDDEGNLAQSKPVELAVVR
jgi:hypothetical protein